MTSFNRFTAADVHDLITGYSRAAIIGTAHPRKYAMIRHHSASTTVAPMGARVEALGHTVGEIAAERIAALENAARSTG
ncbi:hypothetical protein [Flavisphingomonas formosensis]|uniref:hypothetical protein n=1 Tax=Flavisphingomonas formosensis TaxID=861534 RepID=UPI0012F901DC|nr:hypothetical protein [Sphingomonas formosensis]